MNGRTKFLIIGLLLVLALSFFLGHFWSYMMCALQKVVAGGIVPLFVFSKLFVGITRVRFLV
ncbi:MAG TPA: hypothetical protein VNB49_19095 [Candidatus Dormibacteraeota bacterium]|nr:hypothetical protein [Candidatus Dormibacteraeota bacterium]